MKIEDVEYVGLNILKVYVRRFILPDKIRYAIHNGTYWQWDNGEYCFEYQDILDAYHEHLI